MHVIENKEFLQTQCFLSIQMCLSTQPKLAQQANIELTEHINMYLLQNTIISISKFINPFPD
jgi:hypothetical protein